MVQPEHVMAPQLEDAREGIADDGGAQVAHMHLLGNIWRRIVDHNALRRLAPRDA